MIQSITVGQLMIKGESLGKGFSGSVLGAEVDGHRELVGSIIISYAEFASLVAIGVVQAAADNHIAALTAQLEQAHSDAVRLDELHTKEIRRLDAEVAKLRKERDAYLATFNLACRLQDSDQCESHATGDDCEQGEVEHEFYEHLSAVRTEDGRTDPLERGNKKRSAAVASELEHVLNAVDECVSWCPACRENGARGLNPDGTAKAATGG